MGAILSRDRWVNFVIITVSVHDDILSWPIPIKNIVSWRIQHQHLYTECCYNGTNFLQNPHIRHPIAHPLWQNMECLRWLQTLIKFCLSQSRYVNNIKLSWTVLLWHCTVLVIKVHKRFWYQTFWNDSRKDKKCQHTMYLRDTTQI